MPDISPSDAKLLTLVEMAQYDWLDAHPRFQDPVMIAVFGAGFDAGAGTMLNLIMTGKWSPPEYA